MKSLFSDNRAANILQAFRRNSVLRVSALAQKFGVSERTIRNDIKQLNTDLEGCAVITGEQGKYSLRVYDNDQFRIRYVRISETDGMFNTPQNRMDYVFGQLMRSPEPLLTDELAYEMNIGRTTLIGDLKKLRSDISSYGLTVVGKTSKGLLLHGNEFDIRRYVLENNYEAIYRDYPLDREISDMLEEAERKSSLSKNVKKQFRQYITITLDSCPLSGCGHRRIWAACTPLNWMRGSSLLSGKFLTKSRTDWILPWIWNAFPRSSSII